MTDELPPIDEWRRLLPRSVAGKPTNTATASILELLSTIDEQLEGIWSYLRDVDIATVESLRLIEDYLEDVYRLMRNSAHADVVRSEHAQHICKATIGALDTAKSGCRVLRRITARIDQSRAVPTGQIAGAAADEEELVSRSHTAIAAIDTARDAAHQMAELVSFEAAKPNTAGKVSPPRVRRPRQHHQDFQRYTA